MVDSQPLYGLTDSRDEVIGLPCLDDRVEDSTYVGRLLGVHTILMGKLLSDVAVLRGEGLAHLGACVLLTHTLEHLDELVERDLVPVGSDSLLLC